MRGIDVVSGRPNEPMDTNFTSISPPTEKTSLLTFDIALIYWVILFTIVLLLIAACVFVELFCLMSQKFNLIDAVPSEPLSDKHHRYDENNSYITVLADKSLRTTERTKPPPPTPKLNRPEPKMENGTKKQESR